MNDMINSLELNYPSSVVLRGACFDTGTLISTESAWNMVMDRNNRTQFHLNQREAAHAS